MAAKSVAILAQDPIHVLGLGSYLSPIGLNWWCGLIDHIALATGFASALITGYLVVTAARCHRLGFIFGTDPPAGFRARIARLFRGRHTATI